MFYYYHCLKKTPSMEGYICKQYDDPLKIPHVKDVPTRIIPISRLVPRFYHHSSIHKRLCQSIDVIIESDGHSQTEDPILEELLRSGVN